MSNIKPLIDVKNTKPFEIINSRLESNSRSTKKCTKLKYFDNSFYDSTNSFDRSM